MAKFKPFKGRSRSVGIRIEGLDRLEKDLKRMRTKTDSNMTKLIHRTADRIARFANRDVPVDTGRLLKSINVEKFTRAALVKVDAPYAVYVEGRDNTGTPRGRNPQPYFFKHIPPAMKILMQNIKKLI